MVENAVAEVTVTATLGDSGATIEYLDGSDATLTDADTAKDDFQVVLADGDNVIKVKVTAADGNTTETYVVTVNRLAAATPPTIDRVAVTSIPLLTSLGGSTPDTYGPGEDIEFTVTFNEVVEVTGDPQFGFSLAGARVADYGSGSGSERLAFVYTVQPTDQDDDGIWVGNHASGNQTLQLDADDAITSLGGTDANLEHDTLDRLDDHKVDGSGTTVQPVEPVEPVEPGERLQQINCALDRLDGESDPRCDGIDGMPGSERHLVALQVEVIGQLPPGQYDYYDLAGWQTLYKMEDGRVIITKGGDAGPAPLTARLEAVPEAHDGEDAFRFRVAFSEDIGIGFRSMRDASFRVTGGDVTRARRVDKRRDL